MSVRADTLSSIWWVATPANWRRACALSVVGGDGYDHYVTINLRHRRRRWWGQQRSCPYGNNDGNDTTRRRRWATQQLDNNEGHDDWMTTMTTRQSYLPSCVMKDTIHPKSSLPLSVIAERGRRYGIAHWSCVKILSFLAWGILYLLSLLIRMISFITICAVVQTFWHTLRGRFW